MRYLRAARCAICGLLHPAWLAGSAQTTTPDRLAARFCLALFCLDRPQGVENEADDAVVTQRRQGDQLARGSNDDPECRVLEEVHD
jgi:hypothetical protein